MLITFDPAKDARNREKHRISLAEAEHLAWETVKSFHDDRFAYGEDRQVGYGVLRGRLYAVVYTYRGISVRVISLRKANRRERKWYEAH